MSLPATRRADRRVETVREIKAAAWAEMAATEGGDFSLRGVARRLGMAPSALYRYFPSRDDLLTSLIIDAFDDLAETLAETLAATRDRSRADEPGEVFVAVAAAYRRWALADLLRYRLVFGDPLGGYVGTEATTSASVRSSAVLLEVMADLVAADEVDVEGLSGRLDPQAEQSYGRWAAALPHPFPPVALSAAITCYAALHGAINLEVNRHLPPALLGDEAVYLATMRHVVRSILR